MQRDAEGVDRGARAMFWQEECVVTEANDASGCHVVIPVILFPVLLFPQVNACGQFWGPLVLSSDIQPLATARNGGPRVDSENVSSLERGVRPRGDRNGAKQHV